MPKGLCTEFKMYLRKQFEEECRRNSDRVDEPVKYYDKCSNPKTFFLGVLLAAVQIQRQKYDLTIMLAVTLNNGLPG